MSSIVIKKIIETGRHDECWKILLKLDLRVWGKVPFLVFWISPRNIYLNLFGGAHCHWRSLKPCNVSKRTCLSYAWTAIFPWGYCSHKLQIFRLFQERSSKTIECRFTLKHQVRTWHSNNIQLLLILLLWKVQSTTYKKKSNKYLKLRKVL